VSDNPFYEQFTNIWRERQASCDRLAEAPHDLYLIAAAIEIAFPHRGEV